MPLYRLPPDYFLNDFERTDLYGHNHQHGGVYGLTARNIFDSFRKDKQLYVIVTQALAVSTTS
jgi:hypothetical protein